MAIKGLFSQYGCCLLVAICGCASSERSEKRDASTQDASAQDGRAGGADDICTQAGDCEEAVAITSMRHAQGEIKYDNPPPAGGEHNPCWGSWGVHDSPLPPGRWVHNLEHGGVVLLYHCPDGCNTDLDTLKAFVQTHSLTLLSEYAAMPKRFAFVSWGHRLQSDTLDPDALRAFYAAHVDHAPESLGGDPPPGCL